MSEFPLLRASTILCAGVFTNAFTSPFACSPAYVFIEAEFCFRNSCNCATYCFAASGSFCTSCCILFLTSVSLAVKSEADLFSIIVLRLLIPDAIFSLTSLSETDAATPVVSICSNESVTPLASAAGF